MKINKYKKIITIFIVFLIIEKCFFFFNVNFLILEYIKFPKTTVQTDVKIQDKISMDWSLHDEECLLKIAQYYGGNVKNRAYTILVTLNKCYSEKRSIKDIVAEQIFQSKYEEIIPDKLTEQALQKVVMEKFDNSNGSVKYIRWEE